MESNPSHYLQFHQRRYQFLLSVLQRIGQPPRSFTRLLDIGLSYQTLQFQDAFPHATIDTLGYFDHRFTGQLHGRHINFDLNHAADPAAWPPLPPYDIVVMAEVLEHLHTAPTRVLACAASWLRPGGALLLHTPNPVSLGKRLRHLAGHSPFEIIREDPTNPGHFCEYTAADLRLIAQHSNLELPGLWFRNYFGPRVPLYDLACTLLPGQLHDGLTLLLRKPHLSEPQTAPPGSAGK
ncbi:MAG: class I SAM-dependent methyltransferase [Acidobacteriota bacterium]